MAKLLEDQVRFCGQNKYMVEGSEIRRIFTTWNKKPWK